MKQLTKPTPAAPRITAPRPSRSIRQAVPHNTPQAPGQPDPYSKFVEDASPEAKDAFYLKLAGILMKKSAA